MPSHVPWTRWQPSSLSDIIGAAASELRMTAIEELAEIRTEVELELARAQLKQLRNDQQLRESGEVIGDRLGFLDDDARFEYRSRIFTGHESRLSDREDGKNEPIYENEVDLAEIRGDGRLLGQENPAGIGAQVALRNYTFGTGFEYDFSPKDKKDSALAEEVQTWNDEFDERLKWRFYEKEFHERSIQDGEPFLELEPIGGGRVDCLFREPDAITEPNDWRGMDDFTGQISTNWRFGIQTSLGRPHRPLSYFVDLTGDQTDWHWVPAARMVHGKRNVPANCKRGVSDFHPVSSELRRADKVLRNVGEGATVQSAIAFIREHPPGATGSPGLRPGSGKTEFELNRTTPGGTSRTHRYQRYLPGTILDVRAGQVYKPGPMGTGAVFIDVGQAILRYVAVRWNMPEFIISSNAGNTNFACHDDRTEALTARGWVGQADLTEDDLVAVYGNDGRLAFQKPIQIRRYDTTTDMVLIRSRDFDFCVTPNHRMLVSSPVSYVEAGGRLVRMDQNHV